MPVNREPRCTNNHNRMRHYLRDNKLPPTPCSVCGWMLSPAKEEHKEPPFTDEQEDRVKEIVQEILRDLGLKD